MKFLPKFLVTIMAVIVFFLLNLFLGSVDIPASDVWASLTGRGEGTTAYIVINSRLPMALTAFFAGAGLAVSGLLLQTAFRNPLAGPSILGVTSGASLGVAVVMLFLGGTVTAGGLSLGGYSAVIAGALVGALLIMALLIGLSSILKNELTLLVAGIMIGYLVSSAITLLNFSATSDSLQSYVTWGMATFNGVSLSSLPFFCGVTAGGLILAFLLVKPLDLLLLGESYARNLGINLLAVRNLLLLATGLLTAVITAYCGPVSFLGLAMPHIARIFFPTDRHSILMPATMLAGGVTGLVCALVCVLPTEGLIPLNAVTPLIGAPVVIKVLFKR